MATRKPQKGDEMIHHGRRQKIIAFHDRAVLDENGEPKKVQFFAFEGGPDVQLERRGELVTEPAYLGVGFVEELRWSEADGAWYLPGRILANDERTLYTAIFGTWPAADVHLVARKALDAVDLDVLEPETIERLVTVIKTRRKPKLDETGVPAEEYAEACLQHCRELRELRAADRS